MLKTAVLIVTIAFFFMEFFIQANALKCWKCTTSSPEQTDFCEDPFLGHAYFNETAKIKYYVECPPVEDQNNRVVCKKLNIEANGKLVIERRCHEERLIGTPSQQECMDGPNSSAPSPSSFPSSTSNKIIFCQTCYEDGCNSAAVFTPLISLIIIPFTHLVNLLIL